MQKYTPAVVHILDNTNVVPWRIAHLIEKAVLHNISLPSQASSSLVPPPLGPYLVNLLPHTTPFACFVLRMFDIGAAIVSLTKVLKKAILLAENLRYISKKCDLVLHQLRALENLWNDVNDEFHRTIELARKAGAPATRLQPCRDRLISSITSCQTACKDYKELLHKVRSSYFQQWQWSKAERNLPQLHRNLEASKADLSIALNLVRCVVLRSDCMSMVNR